VMYSLCYCIKFSIDLFKRHTMTITGQHPSRWRCCGVKVMCEIGMPKVAHVEMLTVIHTALFPTVVW